MFKHLIERKNDLITRADAILNTAKAENRELTEAEAKELEEIKDNVARINATIQNAEAIRSMEGGTNEEPEQRSEPQIQMRSYGDIEVREDEYQLFDAYIRSVVRSDPTPVNMTFGANGAIVPQTIVNWTIRKVYDICPILPRSQQFNVKGTLQVPYYPADSDMINVAYQTEFSPMVSSAGKFGSVSLTGFLAGALCKVSRSLINNTQFDLVAFVVDEMARAIARFVEGECLHGTADKVDGLSTLTNAVTTASASAITADEVIKLHDSIKDMFQSNAIFIMSSKTRTALRLLKDGVGRYLLNDDMTSPFGISLLGKPVYVSDNMPEIADGGAVIFYGDMHGLATKFNEEINIQILHERFADEHAEGVIGWFEFDAKVIDEQQIAKLVMHA